MTTVQTVGAISNEAAEWFAIDWPSVYRNVVTGRDTFL